MSELRLDVDGKEMTVETSKPLTVICHNEDFDIKAVSEDIVTITPEQTVACADGLDVFVWRDRIRTQPRFLELWAKVWGDVPPPEWLPDATLAKRHTIGLLLLINTAMAQGKRPMVKFPETYLHPKQQLGLADMFIELSKPIDTQQKTEVK